MDYKKQREKLDLTQIDVAKAVGVSLTSYRLWEKGVQNPKPENLKKLHDILQINTTSVRV